MSLEAYAVERQVPMSTSQARFPRILCLGGDTTLLETRCAVLARSGYNAQSALVPKGYDQLRSGAFDLVIVSTCLAQQDETFRRAVPVETRTLAVGEFLFPKDMLAAVAELLRKR